MVYHLLIILYNIDLVSLYLGKMSCKTASFIVMIMSILDNDQINMDPVIIHATIIVSALNCNMGWVMNELAKDGN